MKVSKERWDNYCKVQDSGIRNMFGYDMAIQKDDNWEKCHKHFDVEKKTEPCEVSQ